MKRWQPRSDAQNLTQREIPVLPEAYNLADGHVHLPPDRGVENLTDRLSGIYKTARRESLPELETQFLERFYSLAGQTVKRSEHLLCTSASMSLEIVANHLRMKQMSLSLIEPCFDNLAHIFKRHEVQLEPLPDEYLSEPSFSDYIERMDTDSVCIVTPNNPTGAMLSENNLEHLVRHCEDSGKLLILDTSFRFYDPHPYDQYAILESSDAEYIVIEDTGKTWPTSELKISALALSENLFNDFDAIYTDFLLHVSPFTLALLTTYIESSLDDSLQGVHSVIQQNRERLAGTGLQDEGAPYMSVAWINRPNSYERLADAGVHVLPGSDFFWASPEKGIPYIRLALAREPSRFDMACRAMEAYLK